MITIDELFNKFTDLQNDCYYSYTTGKNRFKITSIDNKEYKIKAVKENGDKKETSISKDQILTLLNAFTKSNMVNVESALSASGNNRTIVESLFALTPHFFVTKKDDKKQLVYCENREHDLGIISSLEETGFDFVKFYKDHVFIDSLLAYRNLCDILNQYRNNLSKLKNNIDRFSEIFLCSYISKTSANSNKDKDIPRFNNEWDKIIVETNLAEAFKKDDPSIIQYDKFDKYIYREKDRKNLSIVTNRLIVPFFPDKLSTIVKDDEIRKLIELVRKVDNNAIITGSNWLERNISITSYFHKKLSTMKTEENFIYKVSLILWDYKIAIAEFLNQNDNVNTNFIDNYSQIIYYGVPGSGKSYTINKRIEDIYSNKEDIEEYTKRVVFHPEYTNADFVGQIIPVVEDEAVKYKFKAGPFTTILINALKNPDKQLFLIIEEINRGNAAAIFGDIFQLLDRDDDGWSAYSIDNSDINYEIRKEVPELNWTPNTGIRLPPNLSLLATMNTSDQNVFTLDNAFQRRWDMQLVKNEFGESAEDTAQRDSIIEDATVNEIPVTWGQFQNVINEIISTKGNESNLSSMEDKRLGCWFVKAEDGKISKEVFQNKVLKYLWDDAFKLCKNEIFTGDITNFEQLQNRYAQIGLNVMPDLYSRLSQQVKPIDTSSAQ